MNFKKLFTRIQFQEIGATAVEGALLVSFLAVVCVVAVKEAGFNTGKVLCEKAAGYNNDTLKFVDINNDGMIDCGIAGPDISGQSGGRKKRPPTGGF